TSATLLLIVFALCEVPPRLKYRVSFGESLCSLGAQRILFPIMAENDDLMLHPLGLAGYLGLYFNLWHMFPTGRLDGGRVIYALWGYQRALAVSWLTIAMLAAFGTMWAGWLAVAVFAALTMIRWRRQHPVERYE